MQNKTKERVLILTEGINFRNGANAAMICYASAFKASGYNVTIAAFRNSKLKHAIDCIYFYYKYGLGFKLKHLTDSLMDKYDLAICPLNLNEIKIKKILSLSRNVFITHTGNFNKKYLFLYDYSKKGLITLVAESEGIKKDLISSGEFGEIITITPPVNLDRKKINKNFCRNRKILMIGSIQKRKNQLLAIKAFKEYLKISKDFRLVIVGPILDKAYFNSLTEFINKHSLNNYIEFLGFRNNLEEYINNCRCILQTSFEEGVPNTIRQGMLAERPIFSSNITGIKGVLDDSNSFLFNKLEDPSELFLLFKNYLADEFELKKRAESAKNSYEKNISSEYLVANIISVLQ